MAKSMIARLSSLPALALCCAGLLSPTLAHAQASAAQKAAAESLFDDALKAMKSGHFAEACPKLEESERIDPAIGTLLYLAECYEKTGRTRKAAERADRLQPTLSKLTLKVVPETAQIASLRVTRDNVVIAKTLFGVALPVDPGKYHIVASADGYQSYEADIEVLGNADSKALEIPALAQSTTAPVAAAAAVPATQNAPPASAQTAPPPPNPPPASGSNGLRTAAYVTGALGVVSLGVGTYFGVKAISKNNDAKDHCPAGNTCNDPAGESLTNDAQSAATVSNITIGIGAAFVVAGVVLYLTSAPKEKPANSAHLEMHPLVGRDLAGIGFGGAFQ